MRPVKHVIVSILFLFCFIQANAQFEEDDDGPITKKKFYAQLNRLKVEYTPPKGYELLYDSHNAQMGMILLTGSRHQLKALKDSLFIYFAVLRIDTSKKHIDKMKKFGFPYDDNQNYLKIAGRDTLKHPIKYDSKKTSLKNYGADRSGTYDLILPYPYKGEYRFCKTFFIHKENHADLWLYFFYNPGSAGKLEKHIAKVSKAVRFID